MSAVLHLIRHDVRRLRWPFVGWIAFVVSTACMSVAAPPLALDGRIRDEVLDLAFGLGMLVEVLFFIGLVSLLVHEDPPSGTEAFWMTRPIEPRDLFAAKLTLGMLVLVVVPVAVQLVPVVALRLDGGSVWLLTIELLIGRTAALVAVFALATVTNNLSRYLLTIVGSLIGAVVIALAWGVLEREPNQGLAPPPLPLPDTTGSLLSYALLLAGGIACAWWQFRAKRTNLTVGLLVFTLVVSDFVGDRWTYPLVFVREPEPPAWTRDSHAHPFNGASPRWLSRTRAASASTSKPATFPRTCRPARWRRNRL